MLVLLGSGVEKIRTFPIFTDVLPGRQHGAAGAKMDSKLEAFKIHV
jgi:hypothetical protein